VADYHVICFYFAASANVLSIFDEKKNEEWHGNGIKIVRKREASEKVKL
jgi:hypothetical protein